MGEEYPYQISKVVQGFDGLALLSRYPIIEHEIHLDVGVENPDLSQPHYIRALLDMDGQQVVVYVLHPPIPQPDPYSVSFYELAYAAYDDHYLQLRIEQLTALIQQETLPVLLLCDCNSTPRSRQYPLIDTLLDDSFHEVGQGFGLTHPVDPFPAIRIDYVWHSEAFVPVLARVWPEHGTSDRYPLVAHLILAN
jgi:vancomycin resistance protein VanJ